MSFLDNLENNLKALESREQRDPAEIARQRKEREAERLQELLRQPHVEALRKSAFTDGLLTECRTIGHRMRTLVQFAWIGDTLRLDAKQRRLELRPDAEGIRAVFIENGVETANEPVNLEGSPTELAARWLGA